MPGMTSGRIAFLGGGQMGRALIGALMRAGTPAAFISVGEPDATCRQTLLTDFGVRAVADNVAAVAGAEIVLLAVKPQQAANTLQPLRPALQTVKPTLLSIAAGLKVADLSAWCGPGIEVVRAMPNRPALVGAGATGVFAAENVSAAARARCETLLRAAGQVVWIDDEALMDVVTAVSGSGPAYFFLLTEALAAAGVARGLTEDSARQLAIATLHGAGVMAATSDGDLARLRAEVTSKGGTTEAALRVLARSPGLTQLVRAAVDAATERGVELSNSSLTNSK